MSQKKKRKKKWINEQQQRWRELVEAAQAAREAEEKARAEAAEAKVKATEAKRVARKNATFRKAYRPKPQSRNVCVRDGGVRCTVVPSYHAADGLLIEARPKSGMGPMAEHIEVDKHHETYEQLYDRVVDNVLR